MNLWPAAALYAARAFRELDAAAPAPKRTNRPAPNVKKARRRAAATSRRRNRGAR